MARATTIRLASACLALSLIGTDRPAVAQDNPPVRDRQVPNLGAGTPGQTGHTTIEVALSVGVLAFGAAVIFLEVLVMLKRRMYWEIWSFKILGLTLVIVAGLFLIVAGYSQDQVAPMMGLLGTVAGYLLGKEALPATPVPPQGGPPSASGKDD